MISIGFSFMLFDELQQRKTITLSLIFLYTVPDASSFAETVFDGSIRKCISVSSWLNCWSSQKLFSLRLFGTLLWIYQQDIQHCNKEILIIKYLVTIPIFRLQYVSQNWKNGHNFCSLTGLNRKLVYAGLE